VKPDNSIELLDARKLQVQVYEDFDDLLVLQPEWDAFMESVDAEIFLSFDWCRIWWKFYGKKRKLAVFVFREGNNICALLPLFLDTIWLGPIPVRFVKLVGTDYLPVTISVPIKKDYVDKVIESLLKEIEPRWRWNLIHLGTLCGKYPLTDQLMHAFESTLGGSYCIESRSKNVQTYFQVEEDWEHQVTSLAQNARKNARKTYREIDKNKIALNSALASEKDFLQMFNNFLDMHQQHWQQLGKPGHFGAWPSSINFHQEVGLTQLKLNRLRLIETKFDDEIVGYQYVYKFGNSYCWFLNARADNKISSRIDFKWIMLRETIENALKDRVSCIDAMYGKYDYKLLMGGEYFPVKDIFIYSRALPNRIRIKFFRSLAWFLDVSYSKLWNARIGPRLGVKRKEFWDSWLRLNSFADLQ